MTESEWLQIAATHLDARWPHAPLPKASLALYFSELCHLPAEHVIAAISAIDRGDGDRFPPTIGRIVRELAELKNDLPQWDAVWGEVQGKLRAGFSTYRFPSDDDWSHPAVAAFVKSIGWRRICLDPNQGTVEAQARERWKGFAERTKREAALVGMPTVGLAALERVNDGYTNPHQLEVGKVLRALPGGGGAA